MKFNRSALLVATILMTGAVHASPQTTHFNGFSVSWEDSLLGNITSSYTSSGMGAISGSYPDVVRSSTVFGWSPTFIAASAFGGSQTAQGTLSFNVVADPGWELVHIKADTRGQWSVYQSPSALKSAFGQYHLGIKITSNIPSSIASSETLGVIGSFGGIGESGTFESSANAIADAVPQYGTDGRFLGFTGLFSSASVTASMSFQAASNDYGNMVAISLAPYDASTIPDRSASYGMVVAYQISPIPEPSPAALMLAGLGMTGIAVSRGKSNRR